jgi:transposase
MANILPKEKQVAVISALAEGASLRAITRMTGIHRSTIAGLALRVGQGCAALLDEKMRDLTCNYLQFDELWGFIGKKEKHRKDDDDPTLGDVWTFCAFAQLTRTPNSFPRSRLASAII